MPVFKVLWRKRGENAAVCGNTVTVSEKLVQPDLASLVAGLALQSKESNIFVTVMEASSVPFEGDCGKNSAQMVSEQARREADKSEPTLAA
jgi:hypothetical protein